MNEKNLVRKFGVTPDHLEKKAAEWESDNWDGGFGEVTHGRPKLYDEDMETVTFRLPISRIRAVESVVKRTGESKSDFFREAIDKALMETA